MKALIAVDDSEHALKTLAVIGKWITAWGVEAHVLTVLKPGASRGTPSGQDFTHVLTPAGTVSGVSLHTQEPMPGLAEDRTQALARARSDADDRLRALSAESGIVPAEIHVEVSEDVPEAVLRTATLLGADLVVVGTHGRTGLSHALLGSVAENIVRRAEIPILVVGPNVVAQ